MTRQITLRVGNVETIIPVSRVSTEVFKTGQWSSRKPAYRQKLSPCREALSHRKQHPRHDLPCLERRF